MRYLRAALFASGLACSGPALAQAPLVKVQIAAASAGATYIAPYLAEAKGYYRDAGLDVSIANFQSGSKAMEAMMGGSVDAVAGAYSNGILMAARGQKVQTFVNYLRCPGYVLAVGKAHDAKQVSDLKGMTIGVTAPGSSTQQALNYLFFKAGLVTTDYTAVGIGNTAGSIAAVRYGKVDATMGVDPGISMLVRDGSAKVLVDLRDFDASRKAVGGDYPEGSLLARTDYIAAHPKVIQALTDAVVRADRFIAASSPEQIVASLPPEIVGPDPDLFRESIVRMKTCYSPDGVLPADGPATVLAILQASDPVVRAATIDLSATFTNQFTSKAQAN